MIETISDLLEQFRKKELELIKKYEIVKHPSIIGEMYEGLTRKILNKSIFEGLNLKVASGKIKNDKGKFSNEIDCMLVEGEGERIRHTSKFIFDINQVLAVIQVKKNLHSKDIKDAYQNLKSVVEVAEPSQGSKFIGRLLRDAYRTIVKKELPTKKELDTLPEYEKMIYHILLMESFYPLRIVWGYYGFNTEYKLREAYFGYLKQNLTTNPKSPVRGFGPNNFPNLVICRNYCLIKNNGIPFGIPLENNGCWPVYVSAPNNSVYYFLELIWTKLSYKHKLSSEIFGEDLELNTVHRFLDCRLVKKNKLSGWEYNYAKLLPKTLEKPLDKKKWEPVFLNEAQFIVFNRLCTHEFIDLKKDKTFKEFIEKKGHNFDDFIKSLTDTGLAYIKDGRIELLTDNCVVGISPEGRFYAGENKSGRIIRWVSKNSSAKS